MINNLLKVHVNKLVMFIVWALSCTIVSAQNIFVTGKVTGANGAVIAGASVKVKDSQARTTTDSDGNFKIDVPARSVLVFSYVGFQEKQVICRSAHRKHSRRSSIEHQFLNTVG